MVESDAPCPDRRCVGTPAALDAVKGVVPPHLSVVGIPSDSRSAAFDPPVVVLPYVVMGDVPVPLVVTAVGSASPVPVMGGGAAVPRRSSGK